MVTVRRGSLAAVAPAQTGNPSRRVSPDCLMERRVARIVPLEALPIDHRPPLASQGAARLVRRTARAQVDGRDHGAHGRDHGAWRAETTAPTAETTARGRPRPRRPRRSMGPFTYREA